VNILFDVRPIIGLKYNGRFT